MLKVIQMSQVLKMLLDADVGRLSDYFFLRVCSIIEFNEFG